MDADLSATRSAGGPLDRLTREKPEVTGYAEVRAALRAWESLSSEIHSEADVRGYRQYPLESDPPAHSAYRAILAPWFHRQRIASLEGTLRSIADDLIAAFVARATTEAVSELALPMVVRSLGVVFGRPQDVDEWMSWGVEVFEPNGVRGGGHLDAYLDRVFLEVASSPGDDLFSSVHGATVDGRPLTRDEQKGIGNLVLAGGRDTVVGLIAAAIWHLGGHPAERHRIASDHAQIQPAIEEFLRYLSPLPSMERKVTPCVGDLDPGSHVAISFLSANHDAAIFSDPDKIDLTRHPNHHLAFGNGPHTCIGAHLARLEARLLLEALLEAAPDFSLAADALITWQRSGATNVPKAFLRLPIKPGG